MKFKTVFIVAASLTLLGCKQKEQLVEQEQVIDSLSQRLEMVLLENKELVNSKESVQLTANRAQRINIEKEDSLHNMRVAYQRTRALYEQMNADRDMCSESTETEGAFLISSGSYLRELQSAIVRTTIYDSDLRELLDVSDLTLMFILGTNGDCISQSQRSDEYGYSLERRIRYLKNRESDNSFDDVALSNNSKDTPHKYLFEYLGDCLGVTFTVHHYEDNDITQFISKSFSTSRYMTPLIDHLFSQTVAVLEHHWSSEQDREELKDAFEYVLSTTEYVDYNAVVDNGVLINEIYETEWNGIQKFFYRAEARYPGSVQEITRNIREYLGEKSVAESVPLDHNSDVHIDE